MPGLFFEAASGRVLVREKKRRLPQSLPSKI
jgi:hypothetical protein